MKRPVAFYMLLIMASIFLFFFLNLVLGSVSIPLRAVWNILWGTGNESVIWQNIIWKSRVPQALTALAAGAGLSVSGLQMQTVFRNPLAGPSVLGISSGASMGVAFVVLLSGSLGGVALSKLGFMGEIALTIAAIAGSLSIMALIVFVLMFAMSNIDSQKFEEIAASLSSSFSVLPQGGSALSKEGILVSSGASQLNELSNYYNNMGLNNDGDMSQDVQNAYEEIEKEGLEQSENMAEEIVDKLTASGVADYWDVKYLLLEQISIVLQGFR